MKSSPRAGNNKNDDQTNSESPEHKSNKKPRYVLFSERPKRNFTETEPKPKYEPFTEPKPNQNRNSIQYLNINYYRI